jgi:hypothetical protein
MLLMRIGRQARWAFDRVADNPDHVSDAAKDLRLDEGEGGLSVYKLEGEEERREIAIRFAVTCRDWPPDPLDCVVFSEGLATGLGLTVALVPRSDLDPYLDRRHCEIIGLTPELALRLAAAILADPGRQVDRLRAKDIPPLASDLLRRDPGMISYLGEGWSEKLDPTKPED